MRARRPETRGARPAALDSQRARSHSKAPARGAGVRSAGGGRLPPAQADHDDGAACRAGAHQARARRHPGAQAGRGARGRRDVRLRERRRPAREDRGGARGRLSGRRSLGRVGAASSCRTARARTRSRTPTARPSSKLANDELDADGDPPRPGEHNYLEVFGIPPTLSVLAARVEADVAPAYEACVDAVDRQGLEQWTGDVIYLDRDRARREFDQAQQDADLAGQVDRGATPVSPTAAPGWRATRRRVEQVRADPKLRGRVDRYTRGQARVRAVRALQARLLCEGLLTARSRYTPGTYDLPTHEALATWERKHDIFGWGFLGGETLGMLLRPPRRAGARRVQALPRRARRRRGGHRRGRLDQLRSGARTRPPGAMPTAPCTRCPI